VKLETGKARDPLRLSGDDHGYFQIDLALQVVELGDGCTGPLFVRTWNDAMGSRAFGDSSDVTLCRARLNAYGDPEILDSSECDNDASCPNRGKCRERTCVFEYECNQNAECRADERCMGSVCVRVVDKTCDSSSDCDGLVCAADKCAACSSSGDRACASGYLCTPGGTCIRPGDTGTSGREASGGSGSGGSGGEPGERVRGGAFTCNALAASSGGGAAWSGIGMVGLAGWLARRRRKAAVDARSSSMRGGR
jgi:LPXTG-motif cell wall-anchored protein